jgi:hypothetical protein
MATFVPFKAPPVCVALDTVTKFASNVVVGSRSRTSGIAWKSDSSDRFAFEITDTNSFWLPCRLTPNDLFFLVPVSGDLATDDEIGRSAAEVISWIWKEPDVVVFKSTIDPEKYCDRGILTGRGKVTARRGGSRLMRDPDRAFLSTTTVEIVAEPPSDVRAPSLSGRVSLGECLELTAESEVLDEENKWHCPHCQEFVCAEKTMQIWSVPRVLIFQLKRFVRSGYFVSKNGEDVEYPDILDLRPYVVGPGGGSLTYRLFAVSEHSGALGGGHYTAHAVVEREGGARQWYSFNDSWAEPVSAEEAHSSLAYLLFYERVDGKT